MCATEGHPGEGHPLATADLEARPPLLARPGSCVLALRIHCDVCGPDAHASTSYIRWSTLYRGLLGSGTHALVCPGVAQLHL